MNAIGTIKDILSYKGSTVWTISPYATVFEAIKLMADKNIGAVLVTEKDRLLGVLTERDYTRKVALRGKTSKQLCVKDILSEQIIHVTSENTVEECMRLMTTHRVRHLPVLRGPEIIGIVSIGDLVNWIISVQNHTIHQLETYIAGYPA